MHAGFNKQNNKVNSESIKTFIKPLIDFKTDFEHFNF